MRKVYADVDVIVALPVRIKGHVIIRANEGADVDYAIRKLLRNQKCDAADLELADLEIASVAGEENYAEADCLELIAAGKGTPTIEIEVSDSK